MANDLEANRTFSFNTEAEAIAFIEGVNYVNDPAVTVLGWEQIRPEHVEGCWVVSICDEDTSSVDNIGEVCDECGHTIPDDEPDMVNAHHAESCSLYPHTQETP